MPADPKKLKEIRKERTLVVVKPDGVARKLIGEIIHRFERKGLKLVGMKLLWPSKELVEKHYTDSEEWLKSSGERTYNAYLEKGITPELNPRQLALRTREKLIKSMSAGPVVAMVWEGPHVIQIMRKLRGATSPLLADVGTVDFDFSLDSYEVSDAGDWATRNILHASDADTAASEIKLWFRDEEVLDYMTPEDMLLFNKDWHAKEQD